MRPPSAPSGSTSSARLVRHARDRARVPAPVPACRAAQRPRRRRAARHGAAGELLAPTTRPHSTALVAACLSRAELRRATMPPAARGRCRRPCCSRLPPHGQCGAPAERQVRDVHAEPRHGAWRACAAPLYSPALAAALPQAIDDGGARDDFERAGRPARRFARAQGDAAGAGHAPLGRLRRGRAAPGGERPIRRRRLRQRVRDGSIERRLRRLAARRACPAPFYRLAPARRRCCCSAAASTRRRRRRARRARRRRRSGRRRATSSSPNAGHGVHRHRLRARRRAIPLHRCRRRSRCVWPSTPAASTAVPRPPAFDLGRPAGHGSRRASGRDDDRSHAGRQVARASEASGAAAAFRSAAAARGAARDAHRQVHAA